MSSSEPRVNPLLNQIATKKGRIVQIDKEAQEIRLLIQRLEHTICNRLLGIEQEGFQDEMMLTSQELE